MDAIDANPTAFKGTMNMANLMKVQELYAAKRRACKRQVL
jgi:hypothetical protein